MTNAEPPHKPLKKEFFFWAVVVIVVWAGVPVLAKLGSTQLNGFEMTFWINLFAMPVVTFWILPRQHRQNLKTYPASIILKLAVVGFLGNLVYQILYFSSYQTITAITGSVFGRIGNVLLVLASIVFLREQHSRWYLLAMVSATIGAFLSVAGSGAQLEILPTIGFWFMAIATVLNTAYNFANNALKRSYPDENANLFIYKASTLVVISIWAVIAPTVLKIDQPYAINLSPRLSDLFIPFLIGAFADGVGFLAFLKIIRLSDSVKVVIVLAFVAITQVFLAILFFKESASIFSAVFAPALVIIPTVIAGILDARTRKTKS